MSRLLIVATLLLIVSGCVTRKNCNKKYPPTGSTRIDSFYIEKEVVKWKDTIIYKQLPPIVVERYVSIKDTLKLTGNYSEAFAWVSNGNILGKLNEGIKPAKIEYKIKEVEVEKEVIRTEYKKEIVNVPYIPLFAKILMWVGIVFISFIIIWLLTKSFF